MRRRVVQSLGVAAVLAACRALFSERGWAATGVRDVATAAGVSVETVYATLGGKVALLTAALDNGLRRGDRRRGRRERPVDERGHCDRLRGPRR